MAITLLRRSERIRNRAAANSMLLLRQTKKQGAGACISSSHQCKGNNKIQRPNQATSPFSTLPDDLVIEILSRLPPKTFFCCRTVCKSWLSLSSDALPLNEHLRPTLGGIFYNKSYYGDCFVNLSRGADKVEVHSMISALPRYDAFRIIDCCNGLLLINALKRNAPLINNLYVFNPATGTLFNVWSMTNDYYHNSFDQTFSLAFNPRVQSQFHIICFTCWIDNNEMCSFIDIFSFEKGKCTSQKELACVPMIKFTLRGTYAEGRVYRVTKQNKILSIDPSKCSYEVIQPPDMKNYDLVGIGQSQGLLHCLSLCRKKGLMFIWVLKSYTKKEWTLKNKLNLHEIYSVLLPRFDVYHSLLRCSFLLGHFKFHPEQDIMFMPVVSDDFFSLDMSTGKLKKELGNLGVRKLVPEYYWFYVPCYLV